MKERVLNWAQQFDTFSFLDNNGYNTTPHTIECILAAGRKREYCTTSGNALAGLQAFINKKNSWLFGHLGFDLKNEIENLSSSHPDRIGFPDLYFFEPEIVIRFNENEMEIDADDPTDIFQKIIQNKNSKPFIQSSKIVIQELMEREEYIAIIEKLRQHILRGDCYEINFCQEFFAENTVINPVEVYKRLSGISPNPFSAIYRVDDKWLICASPERFLKKEGIRLISQPIKGTMPRSANKDNEARKELLNSAKDRSENVMVVDLVRNDLAKVCKNGSVQVDELFGVYSFPQVHHLISTVSGELRDEVSLSEILRATFPMGSMTGAPKKNVLKLIEKYEKTKRGIFSGALGYISPCKSFEQHPDFDFNVVIRSIMYNAADSVLSFQAGSAITFYSQAEKEWEECLLKAKAIKQVLGDN